MQITFKGKTYNTPAQLSDITLGQYIDWYKILNQSASEHMRAIETLSFFTGISIHDVEGINVQQVYNVYHLINTVLYQEELSLTPQSNFEWDGMEWQCSSIGNGKEMTRYEFHEAKTAAISLIQVFKGNWNALPSVISNFIKTDGMEVDSEYVKFMGMDRVFAVLKYLQQNLDAFLSKNA